MRDIHSLQNKWEPQWRLNFQQGGINGGRRGNYADGALRVDTLDTDTTYALPSQVFDLYATWPWHGRAGCVLCADVLTCRVSTDKTQQ
jgi:hypothetical protein